MSSPGSFVSKKGTQLSQKVEPVPYLGLTKIGHLGIVFDFLRLKQVLVTRITLFFELYSCLAISSLLLFA